LERYCAGRAKFPCFKCFAAILRKASLIIKHCNEDFPFLGFNSGKVQSDICIFLDFVWIGMKVETQSKPKAEYENMIHC